MNVAVDRPNLTPLAVASMTIALCLALSLCSCTLNKDGTISTTRTTTEQTSPPQQTSSEPATTTTQTQTTQTTRDNNGVSVHIGDGDLHVDTPVFKMEKNGKGDKLHIHVPEINLETK